MLVLLSYFSAPADINPSHYRSSRNQAYDSVESRRSPRDRSPGRYNDSRDSDQYRGGSVRGGERRRSISDSKASQVTFTSNRDSFREPLVSSRDFPPREPPRGPKALIDVPSGPRASSYGADYRGDFSFRGEFRVSRGRGRGRAWHDDSRDRVRESEREYRDRRDDRVSVPFHDDRSRDRDWRDRDNFRGRRPSSPQGRGRSPGYSAREIRDAPSNLEGDRTRRDSRDASLSAVPPSESLQSFIRGYGKARGGRGRGRGYYDDYHRPQGRSRSPDPTWSRRTQPSATPPPQVPAFGSTSNLVPTVTTAPIISATPSSGAALGPVPGVVVPTAPRSHAPISRVNFGRQDEKVTSSKWISPEVSLKKQALDTGKPETGLSTSTVKHSSPRKPDPRPELLRSEGNEKQLEPGSSGDDKLGPVQKSIQVSTPKPETSPRSQYYPHKRRPILGRRAPNIPVQELHEITDEGSDSDSGDDFDDDYFEDEIAKVKDQIAKASENNPLLPRSEPRAAFLKPFIEFSMDEKKAAQKAVAHEACTAHGPRNMHIPDPGSNEVRSASKLRPKSKSRQASPLLQPEATIVSKLNGKDSATLPESPPATETMEAGLGDQVSSTVEPQVSSTSIGGEKDLAGQIELETPSKSLPNGKAGNVASMDLFNDGDDDQTEAEKLETLQAVRKMMATPPLSSLPKFNVKPWFEDQEFLKSLEPTPAVEDVLSRKREETRTRRLVEQEEERQRWKERYLQYRMWTDFSDDPVAVRSREKFAKAALKAAAEAEAGPSASNPVSGARQEGQRRTGSRWASEHDFERVLRESEREAKETKEKEERIARARTASEKEALIPSMWWDEEERLANTFIDKTHIVPFDRSFARLEFGEPVDNFSEEELQIFEKTYLEFPKQWGKIAEALSRRDYKACIQHYYLVKHTSNLKEKLKKQPKKKRGKGAAKGPKPKSNALMADLGNRDEGEDAQDVENGVERRRPRRAAAPTFAFEATPGENETMSPAPTPGRKTTATPKGDMGSDTAPTKKKAKLVRDKASKQSKTSQLLAAAPTSSTRTGDSPTAPSISTTDWKTHSGTASTNRFPPQYDGAPQLQPGFAPPYVPTDRAATSMSVNFDVMPQQSFSGQERLGSAPPSTFEAQHDRRNTPQTSSYWSVPEQTDFPALLRHFGTDWHGIAKWMASKTHIMVKNYYQRQVDSGKMSAWEEIAKEADEKRERGESTGPLLTPTILPKRRYDGPTSSLQRPASAVDNIDDMTSVGQNMLLQKASPPQPSLSTRFPALAQAGPVPQSLGQPAAPNPPPTKQLPQKATQHTPQPLQQQNRALRGPALGYFNADPQRPIMQATTSQQPAPPVSDMSVSQRSLMVAQEAQIERQQAVRIEQQQQAMKRERQLQMKQEADIPNLHQYEPYSTQSAHSTTITPTRAEASLPSAPTGVRRTAVPQEYQPRNHQAVRNLVSDNAGQHMKVSPSPALPRASMTAPPINQEQYSANPSQLPVVTAARQQETVRKTSSIMSLLNDEPSEPRPQPKRINDVSTNSLQASHASPPQHPLKTSRYATHNSQTAPQPPQQLSQQIAPQQPPPSQHPYTQPPQHGIHQHSSSVGPSRSYTPNNFEARGYIPQQQQMYSQPSRGSQPATARRESSLGDIHGATNAYPRASNTSQTSMRLNESPYSATPPPQPQASRQQMASPLDMAQPPEREYYSRQPYIMQQQLNAAGSPPLGPSYHSQPQQQQQQQPSHGQLGFGQGPTHASSPLPTQYATQHQMHRSRHNSFDGRYSTTVTSAPASAQQGYTQAPQHHSTPMQVQYQRQHPSQERFESNYDRERRMQEEAYHQR